MPTFSPKWTGPIFCAAGALMLAAQAYALLRVGVLDSWLIGGGIGLLLVGALAWFMYFVDLRSGGPRDRQEGSDERPSAEECG